jgi:DNA modification methylase
MGMGWRYRRSYETVLVGYKPGANMRWFDDSKRIENIIRPGDYGIRKIIPSAEQHPTQKAVELAAHFIRLHSQPGHTVLDPFMGSGTTGEAALSMGRSFIGIEQDEHWHSVAQRRIKDAQQQLELPLAEVGTAAQRG